MKDHSEQFAQVLKENIDPDGLCNLFSELMSEIAVIEALLEECFSCDEGVCFHERPMEGDLPDPAIECPSLRGMEKALYEAVDAFNSNPRVDVAIELGLGLNEPRLINQSLKDFQSRMDERNAR